MFGRKVNNNDLTKEDKELLDVILSDYKEKIIATLIELQQDESITGDTFSILYRGTSDSIKQVEELSKKLNIKI